MHLTVSGVPHGLRGWSPRPIPFPNSIDISSPSKRLSKTSVRLRNGRPESSTATVPVLFCRLFGLNDNGAVFLHLSRVLFWIIQAHYHFYCPGVSMARGQRHEHPCDGH